MGVPECMEEEPRQHSHAEEVMVFDMRAKPVAERKPERKARP